MQKMGSLLKNFILWDEGVGEEEEEVSENHLVSSGSASSASESSEEDADYAAPALMSTDDYSQMVDASESDYQHLQEISQPYFYNYSDAETDEDAVEEQDERFQPATPISTPKKRVREEPKVPDAPKKKRGRPKKIVVEPPKNYVVGTRGRGRGRGRGGRGRGGRGGGPGRGRVVAKNGLSTPLQKAAAEKAAAAKKAAVEAAEAIEAAAKEAAEKAAAEKAAAAKEAAEKAAAKEAAEKAAAEEAAEKAAAEKEAAEKAAAKEAAEEEDDEKDDDGDEEISGQEEEEDQIQITSLTSKDKKKIELSIENVFGTEKKFFDTIRAYEKKTTPKTREFLTFSEAVKIYCPDIAWVQYQDAQKIFIEEQFEKLCKHIATRYAKSSKKKLCTDKKTWLRPIAIFSAASSMVDANLQIMDGFFQSFVVLINYNAQFSQIKENQQSLC